MTVQPRRKPRRVVLGWQPIETAPKDGRVIWIVEDGEPLGMTIPRQGMAYWQKNRLYSAGGAWASADRDYVTNPTHWMPLPDPPKAKRRA